MALLQKRCNLDNQDFFFLSMFSNSACHLTSMWIARHLPAILLTEKNMHEKMKKIFGFILVYMQPQGIFARHFWETLCFVNGDAGYPSYCQVQKDLQRTTPYSQCVFPRWNSFRKEEFKQKQLLWSCSLTRTATHAILWKKFSCNSLASESGLLRKQLKLLPFTRN